MHRSNKKKLLIVIISLLALVGLGIGVTYANYRWNFIGNLTSSVKPEGIDIEFLESQDNVVYLSNALPLTDNEGKNQEDTFDFAVSSRTNHDATIAYTISLEKLEADTGYTFLDDDEIKVYLEDYEGNVVVQPTLVSNLNNYVLYQGVQEHDGTERVEEKFKLRVWIDESKEEDAKQWDLDTKLQYKFKINLK